MATINAAGDIRVGTTALYQDNDASTGGNPGLDVNADIRFPGGSHVQCTDMSIVANDDAFRLDNGIFEMNFASDGAGPWTGTFELTNSAFVYAGTANFTSWPNWRNGGQVATGPNRTILNIANSTAYSINGQTLIFPDMQAVSSTAGVHNLAGFAFGPNNIGSLGITSIDYQGLTFGNAVAGQAGRDVNLRVTLVGGTTNWVEWMMFHSCDFDAWAVRNTGNDNNIVLTDNNNWTNNATNPTVFWVNNDYSQALRNQGDFTWFSRNVDSIPRHIVGEGWNPRFLDNLSTNDVTDVKIDFGDRNIHEGQGTAAGNVNQSNALVVHTPVGGVNEIATHNGNTRRSGFIVESGRILTARAVNTNIPIPANNAPTITVPFWSYTNECYTNRNLQMVTSARSVMTTRGIFRTEDSVNRTIANEEALLNNRDMAAALSLNTTTGGGLGTLGTNDFDNAYAMMKERGFTGSHTVLNATANGTNMDHGAANVSFALNTTTVASNNLNGTDVYRARGTWAGGTLYNGVTTTGNIAFTGGNQNVSSMTFNCENISLTNLTIGTGVVVNASGDINDWPTTVPAATYRGTAQMTAGTTYTFDTAADVSGLNLPNNTGTTIVIQGAPQNSFASVGSGYVFPFNITFNVDRAADITIRRNDGTYLTYSNVTQQVVNSNDLPDGLHHVVASRAGFAGNPQILAISGEVTINLTTNDLSLLGYTTAGVNIGTARTAAKVTYEGRPTFQFTENGKNDYLTNNLESVRWFGDLWGQELFREVILDNIEDGNFTADQPPFTLNAANNVTSIDLPIIRAIHGSTVNGRLDFQADQSAAQAIDADYQMTDGINLQVTAADGAGVSANVNNVQLLTGTINAAASRTVDQINQNVDAEATTTRTAITTTETNLTTEVQQQHARTRNAVNT